MALDKLIFNWFDLLVVIAVVAGVRAGRKHGMSEELLRLFKWLALLFGCAYAYQPLGSLICAVSPIFNTLNGYLIAYLTVALVITGIFAFIKRHAGEKLVSSEVFGQSEFYLGMIAGTVRFGCMVLMGMALLNARDFKQSEIRADIKYQNDVYGSTYFPKLYNIQSQVFRSSLIGPLIKDNLSFLLIKPTGPEKKELNRKQFDVY
jgi:uncharacterized membrane protein required for colicin V production